MDFNTPALLFMEYDKSQLITYYQYIDEYVNPNTVDLIQLLFQIFSGTISQEHDRAESRSFFWSYIDSLIGPFDQMKEKPSTREQLTHVFAAIQRDIITCRKALLSGFHAGGKLLFRLFVNLLFLITFLYMYFLLLLYFLDWKNRKPMSLEKKETVTDTKDRAVAKSPALAGNRSSSLDSQTSSSKRSVRAALIRGALWFIRIYMLSFILTLAWEYYRLYQETVAKKAALTSGGAPPECTPGDMNIFQKAVSWLGTKFSWSDDPCETYYRALLVPAWVEVSPLKVISSTMAMCVTVPFEALMEALGRGFRNFFQEIPAHWQIFAAILIAVLFCLGLVMMCGNRIRMPFLSIEPKTPVIVRSQSRKEKSEELKAEKYQSSSSKVAAPPTQKMVTSRS